MCGSSIVPSALVEPTPPGHVIWHEPMRTFPTLYPTTLKPPPLATTRRFTSSRTKELLFHSARMCTQSPGRQE